MELVRCRRQRIDDNAPNNEVTMLYLVEELVSADHHRVVWPLVVRVGVLGQSVARGDGSVTCKVIVVVAVVVVAAVRGHKGVGIGVGG